MYYNLSVGPIKRYAIIGLVHLTINKLPSALSSHLSTAPTASTGACLLFPLAGSTKECRKCCKMTGRENHLSVFQELPGFHFKPWRFPGPRRACPELHPCSAAEEFPDGWLRCLQPVPCPLEPWRQGDNGKTILEAGSGRSLPNSDTCHKMCFSAVLCPFCSSKSCVNLTKPYPSELK